MATAAARHGAGVVISAGKMTRTVTVRMVKREWDRHLRKNFYAPYKFLVHDPNNSLVEGDVITCEPERHAKKVSHVVSSILAPFGRPIEERPPIMSAAERAAIKDEKYWAQNERRAARGKEIALKIVQARGLSQESAAAAAPKTSGAEVGKHGQTMEHGRTVLPDGKHKYGGRGEGGIQKEAWTNKQRAMEFERRGVQHEEERERVESVPTEQVAKEHLEGR